MLKIWCAQLNPTVGDLKGNAELAKKAHANAARNGADVLLLTELFICAYPPEDLLLKADFVAACMERVEKLATELAEGPMVLIGTPWLQNGKLYNAVALLQNGTVADVAFKTELPNYSVFDEKRYFTAAEAPAVFTLGGVRVGIAVCEDLWLTGVAKKLAYAGAEIIVSANASPFVTNKRETRSQIICTRMKECGLPILYLNQWGGQDELVFDGRSFAVNTDGNYYHAQEPWADAQFMVVAQKDEDGIWAFDEGPNANQPDHWGDIYAALVTGTRDYVNKIGFKGVVLGLSGGIDSALVAAIAVDALGSDRVKAILLPSPYSSDHSISDAEALATNLGIETNAIPIKPGMDAFNTMLAPLFKGLPEDVTEENIQARIRGILLMAYSNKFGHMVLTTGNKSEMSVGYATLYGDMNGGYNPIKDIYKSSVFEICKWRNKDGEVIPHNIISKPPSAELRPDQYDSDSLPDYDVLDPILRALIEEHKGLKTLMNEGHDGEMVLRAINMLRIAEYKRRQAPPGVKVTDVSFGKDYRYPIVNKHRPKLKNI